MASLVLPFMAPLVASCRHDAATPHCPALMDKAHFITACRRGGGSLADALRQLQRD